jgi:hypothetical protein
MGSLAIRRLARSAGELAARSRAWRAPPGADAVLTVAEPQDAAVVVGAFQRSSEIVGANERPILRRGSGGAACLVGPGTVWIELALARSDALVACTPDKLLNRYVRPLLRAITGVTSVPANYFGRDWISAAHRPIALVSFGHEATTNAALFEAVVAVDAPFAIGARASFLGKEPATLGAIAARPVTCGALVDRIVEGYSALATTVVEVADDPPPLEAVRERVGPESPWSSTREEAIGLVAAGRDETGRLRVGGELIASGDAVARLEDLLAKLPDEASADDVGRLVDEALTTRGAVTFGVRSLASIRDVIVEARQA